MKRCILAMTLGMLAVMTAVAPAAASKGWCRTDPLVLIDGEIADVFVSGPLTAPLRATGPNEVIVSVPVGVSAYLVLGDLGFGRGTRVTFTEASDLQVTEQGIEVRVDVFVPANTDAMPIRVEFAPRILGILWPATAHGAANTWVTLEVTF